MAAAPHAESPSPPTDGTPPRAGSRQGGSRAASPRPAWIGRPAPPRRRPAAPASEERPPTHGHAPAGVSVVHPGTPLATPPDVTVVIPVRNGRDDLAELLPLLDTALDDRRVQVLVVDRASLDRTTSLILNEHPTVTLVRSASDLGAAWSWDIGLARAAGPLIVLLDQGARPDRQALVALLDHAAEDPGCGAVCAGLVTPDGTPLPGSAPFPTLRHLLVEHSALGLAWPDNPWRRRLASLEEDRARGPEVDEAPGGLTVLRRDVLDVVGPFDTTLPHAFFRLDWLRRLRRAGYAVHLRADLAVPCRPGEPLDADDTLRLHHDRIRYARKHHGAWGVRCASLALWSWALWEAGARLLQRRPVGERGLAGAFDLLVAARHARARA